MYTHTHHTLLLLLLVCVCVFIQVITLEGWVDIMYYVMDAHSFYNFIYFIFLIIVSARAHTQVCTHTHTQVPAHDGSYWVSVINIITEYSLELLYMKSAFG